MKAKKYWILVMVSVAFVIAIWATTQVSGKTKRSGDSDECSGLRLYLQHLQKGEKTSPLSGLRTVKVVIDGIKEEAEKDGLWETRLQTTAELKLRQAGVKVDIENTEANLVVEVRTMKHTEAYLYAFCVRICLSENVYPERDTTIRCLADTWRSGEVVGTVGRYEMPKTIHSEVNKLMDEFMNDYLAANPKKPPAKKDSIEGRQ